MFTLKEQELFIKYLNAISNTSPDIQGDTRHALGLLTYGVAVQALFPIDEMTANVLRRAKGVSTQAINSTFYQTVKDQLKAGEEGLHRVQQVLHYLFAYAGIGTYTDNEMPLLAQEAPQDLVFIRVLSSDEIVQELAQVLNSGIALPSSDMDSFFDLVEKLHIPTDLIANRELNLRLRIARKEAVADAKELVRVVNYLITNSTLYAKGQRQLDTIRTAWLSSDRLDSIEKVVNQFIQRHGEQALADYFRPDKQFWLAVKRLAKRHQQITLPRLINRLKRLSDKSHIPTPDNNRVIEAWVEGKVDLTQYTVYRLVTWYNYAKQVLARHQSWTPALYGIRTGRVYARALRPVPRITSVQYAPAFMQAIGQEFHRRYHDKFQGYNLLLQNGVTYAMPASVKHFVGNIPRNTQLDLGRGQVSVGVAWSQEGDVDLHAQSSGRKFGFCASYDADGYLYSGDMVRLNKHGHAAEYITITPDVVNDQLHLTVNPYRLDDHTGLTFTVSVVESDDLRDVERYVDPRNIRFTCPLVVDQFNGKTIGACYTEDGHHTYVFTDYTVGGHVPHGELGNTFTEALKHQADNSLTFNEFLTLIGYDPQTLSPEAVDYDLSLTKSSPGLWTDLLAHD